VTLFLPMGLSSLFGKAKGLVWRSRETPPAALADPAHVLEPAGEPADEPAGEPVPEGAKK
jgi:hypothetical protein